MPKGERSHADKLRRLAAIEAIRAEIKGQQDLYWRWFYGQCKERLHGPFKTVIETLERIEAAYDQRYANLPEKDAAWAGFMHYVFTTFILQLCRYKKPETIERRMWGEYQTFLEAGHEKALYGDGRNPGLLRRLHDYEDWKRDQGWWRSGRRQRTHEQKPE